MAKTKTVSKKAVSKKAVSKKAVNDKIVKPYEATVENVHYGAVKDAENAFLQRHKIERKNVKFFYSATGRKLICSVKPANDN